jgi:hypothetical protein
MCWATKTLPHQFLLESLVYMESIKKVIYLLIYRRRIPSKFLGANLPLTTNLCCPSRDPLVPNSARRKAMTWSACRCILKFPHQRKWKDKVHSIHAKNKKLCTKKTNDNKLQRKAKRRATSTHVLHRSMKFTKTVFFVPSRRT